MAIGVFGPVIVAMLAWGALAFGAVYPWAYWPLAAAGAALGIWGLALGGGSRQRDPLTLAIAAVALAIGLQIVPLPHAIFVRLSPGADALLGETNFAYAMRPPAWHALSILPAATFRVLLLFLSFGLLLIGLTQALSRLRLDWLVARLIALGVALALIGVVQKALSPAMYVLVYGFWKPEQWGNPFGPFINRNHFAGWMVMALPVAVGYAFAAVHTSPNRPHSGGWRRWLLWSATPDASRVGLLAFSVLAMGTSLVLTGSRSGIASFGAAMLAFGYFMLRRTGARATRRWAAIALAVLFLGAIVWAGAGSTFARFAVAHTDAQERFSAWHDTLRIARDFPWFGTGFGTYAVAMIVYQTADRTSMFFQAHNDYLQILAEGGLLVVIPAAIAIGLMARTIRRRLGESEDAMRHWIRVGATAGLIGIAIQSLVEFSLQMPGNVVLFVFLAAVAMHRGLDPVLAFDESPGRSSRTHHARRI